MSEIDEIKARLDIIDLVQSYTPLKKAGRNYKGICPFHTEKTPSFVVFPDSQTWRCFGACSDGGDMFSFMMKAEGWDFAEALKMLSERAGVDLKPRTPESTQQQENTEKLHGLLGQAAEYFMTLLLDSPQAEQVRNYVAHRGLVEQTVRDFAIGYAPDGWQTLMDHFLELGYSIDDLREGGLITENDAGRVYDRFRNRLMIPIRDSRGRVVGFGARALTDDQMPKYLNSPQGPLFDKSHLLYGLDLARRDIRETETVVVVEGYMDVIQAHQAGYRNVVAQMGTALTNTQVQLLAKYANRLILALDSDSAGVRATMRGLNVVHESLVDVGEEESVSFDARGMMSLSGQLKLDTRILNLPEGKDPDEFIRNHAQEWPQVVANAIPLADYVIDVGTKGLTVKSDIYERERVARELLPLLTATENDLQRNQNIQRLAMRLHIPERDLLGWARRESPRVQPQRPVNRNSTNQPVRNNNTGFNNRERGNLATPPALPNPARQTKAPPVNMTGRALTLERYCLSILLQEPLWVFAADRKFRQLALLAGDNEFALKWLGPLTANDFIRGDHRALLLLIRRASEQDAIEPPLYIEQNLTSELERLVEMVLPEPLENFHKKSSEMHRKALEGVLRDAKRRDNEAALESDEFLRRVLEMRLERIERETSEHYFVDQDNRLSASNDDSLVDYRLVWGMTKAKELIQRAKNELR